MFQTMTVPWTDERRPQVARMCHNGTYLGCATLNRSSTYWCVDGKVWLIVLHKRIVLLGDYTAYRNEVRRGVRAVSGVGA